MDTPSNNEERRLPSSLFQTSFPEMMHPIRILIIDHDVCTYHSFDLFEHLVLGYAQRDDMETFSSIEREHLMLINSDVPITRRIHHFQTKVYHFDPRLLFSKEDHAKNTYEVVLRDMIKARNVPRTQTDVGARMRIVFQRNNVHGFLLRYSGDMYRTPWNDLVTVYESDSLMDINMILAIMNQDGINAVMVGSVDMAVAIGEALIKDKSRELASRVSFIIGRYAYNYEPEVKRPLLRLSPQMAILARTQKFEFGNFEPFKGLYVYTKDAIKEAEKKTPPKKEIKYDNDEYR